MIGQCIGGRSALLSASLCLLFGCSAYGAEQGAYGFLLGGNLSTSLIIAGSSYSIGVRVTGVSGSTSPLVLQNNGDDLSIASDGSYDFATEVADGAAGSVSVLTHPAGLSRRCAVSGGSGTLTQIAGAVGVNTYVSGPAIITGRLYEPNGVTTDGDALYISDTRNWSIRKYK